MFIEEWLKKRTLLFLRFDFESFTLITKKTVNKATFIVIARLDGAVQNTLKALDSRLPGDDGTEGLTYGLLSNSLEKGFTLKKSALVPLSQRGVTTAFLWNRKVRRDLPNRCSFNCKPLNMVKKAWVPGLSPRMPILTACLLKQHSLRSKAGIHVVLRMNREPSSAAGSKG